VIGAPEEKAVVAEELDARLEAALAGATLKDAVARVTAETGLKRNAVYARALALAGKRARP
jgi:16S rRNA (cytidine1402-2'-O)-methyltransferase